MTHDLTRCCEVYGRRETEQNPPACDPSSFSSVTTLGPMQLVLCNRLEHCTARNDVLSILLPLCPLYPTFAVPSTDSPPLSAPQTGPSSKLSECAAQNVSGAEERTRDLVSLNVRWQLYRWTDEVARLACPSQPRQDLLRSFRTGTDQRV